MIGQKVLIRDHRAGVHVGVLHSFDAAMKTAELHGARKIWYWVGAASCHGIAARGLDTVQSMIGPTVSAVISCDVVEIVAMTDQAFACVIEAPEWTP